MINYDAGRPIKAEGCAIAAPLRPLIGYCPTLMLGNYASDFYGIAIQRKVLGPWTAIRGARTGMSSFGHSAPMNAHDTGYTSLLRSTAMSELGSISVSRDNLVFVSDNFI